MQDTIVKCAECGLPTSRWDDAEAPPVGWYCDGPNDLTGEAGCFTLTDDNGVVILPDESGW